MTSETPKIVQITISHLPSKEALSSFKCGEAHIDHWAKTKAFKLHEKRRHRVYIASLQGNLAASGFYSLSLQHQTTSKLPRQEDRDAWHTGAPFVFLDFLGVLKSMQGNGLGRLLLMDAARKTAQLSEIAPVYGLALRSLNERTTSLYERLAFAVAPDEDRANQPLMILPIFTINDLLST